MVVDLGGEGMFVLCGVEDIKVFEVGQLNCMMVKVLFVLMEVIVC